MEPSISSRLRPLVRLPTYLREIHEKAEDQLLTERAERLAGMAKVWSGEVASTALAIQRALDGDDSGAP